MARRVPGEETWTLLPQVNRQLAVRWLVVLATRRLTADLMNSVVPGPSGEVTLP